MYKYMNQRNLNDGVWNDGSDVQWPGHEIQIFISYLLLYFKVLEYQCSDQ